MSQPSPSASLPKRGERQSSRLAERSEDLSTEHASTANYAVSQQAALFVSQPAHSATPVDIGLGHMGLDDVANSTSTQPLDQASHDALSKAALLLATAGHAVAGEKIKLADYVIGEGNLLPSVTALFSTLDRVPPVDPYVRQANQRGLLWALRMAL